jgi:hypothetical protein
VAVLHPVVQVLVTAVLHQGHDLAVGGTVGARLVVLFGEVGDAAGWWVAADAGVGSVVVVPVQPVGKRGLSFGV